MASCLIEPARRWMAPSCLGRGLRDLAFWRFGVWPGVPDHDMVY